MMLSKIKFLCLLFVCLWESVQCAQRYPRPSTKINNREPGKTTFEITWGPVENWDEDNPIIGYKLVFWEMQTAKKEIFVGDELKLVEDDNPFATMIPVGLPTIYDVPANKRKVVIDNIKSGVWYEYAVLAYTKKGEGPLSPPSSIKFDKGIPTE